MNTIAIIPARYSSTRLPGKPLLDICGKPMIQRVYEAVRKAAMVDTVIIATDDERIVQAVQAFGGNVLLTSPQCASGTDRLVEVARKEKADIYINVQGDEPLVRPSDVDNLIQALLDNPQVAAATPCYPVTFSQAADPNLVKIVRNDNGTALYFSRARIPYDRDGEGTGLYWGHAGMYAYRRQALDIFATYSPGMLERTEKLEQLRLLEHDCAIQTVEIEPSAPGVDTPEDLERVRAIVAGKAMPANDTKASNVPDLSKIRLIITDVDGVLTDGGLYYGPDGECLKRFNALDGLGMMLLKKTAIKVAVLSGRDCPALRRRLQDLGIDMYRLGKVEKRAGCESLLQEAGVRPDEAVFIGDDLPDLDGFACCGLGVTVANAHDKVKAAADIVLKTQGGQGAFRELTDMLLAQYQE